MNDIELLPCPFCGYSNPWLEDIDLTRGTRWYVFCPKCGATGGYQETRAEAAESWNARMPEQAVAATLGTIDKGIPQGADGQLDQSQIDWLRLMPDGWDPNMPPTMGAYKPCPWCGRDMDKRSEADKDNAGHTWYRDDSDYIRGLIRSNEFMKKERATSGADDGSRWSELFGTPKRAAKAIVKTASECDGYGWHCSDCPFHLAPICPHCVGAKRAVDYGALLEWLRGKAVRR